MRPFFWPVLAPFFAAILPYKFLYHENTKKMENGIDHVDMYISAHQSHFYYGNATH